MTHEFKITYRGIPVPENVAAMNFKVGFQDWQAGVDAALSRDEVAATPELRVITDGDGDEWFELEPGKFWFNDPFDPIEAQRERGKRPHSEPEVRDMYGIRSIRPREATS